MASGGPSWSLLLEPVECVGIYAISDARPSDMESGEDKEHEEDPTDEDCEEEKVGTKTQTRARKTTTNTSNGRFTVDVNRWPHLD